MLTNYYYVIITTGETNQSSAGMFLRPTQFHLVYGSANEYPNGFYGEFVPSGASVVETTGFSVPNGTCKVQFLFDNRPGSMIYMNLTISGVPAWGCP